MKFVQDRVKEQQPQCLFGLKGVCCKNCWAGPCRIIPGKQEKGICGADANLIAARNLLRSAAAGASCHVDHAREILLTLMKIGQGKIENYKIKDEKKLREIAKRLGKNSEGDIKKVALEVALEGLEDLRRQEGVFHKKEEDYLNWLKISATEESISKWKKLKILPVNSDMEVSRAIHQTTMGNDADPVHILLSVLKIGLVDGYGGLQLATDLQDVIFGTPYLVKTEANLGTLKKDYVNLVVHGHNPLLSEKIVENVKGMENQAKKAGAKGINIVGMCCSGNEILMRQGIPLAGHILQQELAIATGVADVVVVDMQCIYPSLQDIASCYHTKLITTVDYVRMPQAEHIEFTVDEADKIARRIIQEGINAYKKRNPSKISIPKEKSTVYAGFSAECILAALSKLDSKDPFQPLIENLKNGNILGIVGIVGCRNPKLSNLKFHEKLTKTLIKNNILIVGTGCWAHVAAQENLMTPEAAKLAGPRLRKVLEVIGKANGLEALPPCLHMGSCVDCSRIGTLLKALSERTKIPVSKLPVVASAPEAMTEKAAAIGSWALALGLTTHINPFTTISGSPLVTQVLTKDLENLTGGKVLLAETPEKAADLIIEEIRKKRKNLGWD